jgi:hypothetical protein
VAYFTNLCASVATNVNPSGENWKNTPDITGRKSSLPAAKIVLLMAVANTSQVLKLQMALLDSLLWKLITRAYASAYFPELEPFLLYYFLQL